MKKFNEQMNFNRKAIQSLITANSRIMESILDEDHFMLLNELNDKLREAVRHIDREVPYVDPLNVYRMIMAIRMVQHDWLTDELSAEQHWNEAVKMSYQFVRSDRYHIELGGEFMLEQMVKFLEEL